MSDDCIGLSNARAIWDFTTGDARRFCDRLELIIGAADQFKQLDIAVDFVLLLHGHATQFAARSLADTKFANREAPDLAQVHALLQRFTENGGRIEICRIAMDRCAIAPDNVIGCAIVEHNVFVNSVALQNRGYAYMPFA